MLKEFSVTVDIEKHINNPVYTFSTSDWNSLKFLVTVQKNGAPADLTGIIPRIAIVKKDKTTILQDGAVTDAINGKCEFLLTSQAYVVGGVYKAEVMLYEDTQQVAVTSGFTYTVSIGVMNIDLESSNDWPTLSKAIEAGENEAVRITAESDRVTAESIRIANETTREANETARQANSTTAVTNAEQATTGANTAAAYANEQADRAKAEADRLTGTDVSVLDNKIGSLPNLTTTDKTSVVNAINEHTTQLAQITTIVNSNGTGDSTNINAVISALNAKGGGTLLLPDSLYIIDSTVTLKSNIRIYSQQGTTIKQKDGANLQNLFSGSGVSNIQISNLKFDLNIANQSSYTSGQEPNMGRAIFLSVSSSDIEIDHVTFLDMFGSQIYIVDSSNVNIHHCKLFDLTGRYGVTAFYLVRVQKAKVWKCKLYGQTGSQYGVQAKDSVSQITVSDCYFEKFQCLLDGSENGVPIVNEVETLQITAGATSSSNVTITLNGVATTIAVTAGDTAIQIADKIRVGFFQGWIPSGTAGTDTVIFTATSAGDRTDPSFSGGTTGVTGTIVTTTQGVAPSHIGTSLKIINCNLQDPAADTTIRYAHYGEISNCIVRGSGDYGISVGNSDSVVVSNNIVEGSNTVGIGIRMSNSVIVIGNMLKDPCKNFKNMSLVANQRDGIYVVGDSKRVIISGNVVNDFQTSPNKMYHAIRVEDVSGGIKGNDSSFANISNNTTYGSSSGIDIYCDGSGNFLNPSNQRNDNHYTGIRLGTDPFTVPAIGDLRQNAVNQKPYFYDGTAWRVIPKQVSVPATSTSAGKAGDIAFNSSYFYWCPSDNVWCRVAKDATVW